MHELTNMKNRVTDLLSIQYPVIQAGMVWCSGWRLAAACSNNGVLGVIGSGSMRPHVLEEHLQKCKANTDKPFGVNLPLLYPEIGQHLDAIVRYKVPVVITSAGNPRAHTAFLKDHGITVLHVVSSAKFAEKATAAGVDGIICEGFEAGGHNGREETTTMCLVPAVRQATDLPLVAAGGIASGKAMLAAMALGAEGVQVGSRFVAAEESSAHANFKAAVIHAGEGDTKLTLKEITPVRLLRNDFSMRVQQAYEAGAKVDVLRALLGRGRARLGMFDGDMSEGELEIGQVAAHIRKVMPAADIVAELIADYDVAFKALRPIHP